MNLAIEIVSFAILIIPTAYELWDDKQGETLSEKKRDVYVRAGLMLAAAVISGLIRSFYGGPVYWAMCKALVMSFALFLFIFDYAINVILGRPKPFSYLSNSPLDKLWKHWHPGLRFAVR